MNPLGAGILFLLIVVVIFSPRRGALLGMMAGVLFLTQVQQITILGLNLYALRFLELAGFVRVMARHEFSFRHLNSIDRALLWLYGFTTIVFLLRSSEGQAYQIGLAVDAFLSYFTFRGLLADMADFCWFLRVFVILLIPYTLLVITESVTWHNPFTVLGAVDGGEYWSRHGRPRCFGSFRQPDTLGMFAASFLPVYIGLACISKERKRAFLAICLCLVIVWAANAGGAAAAAAMGLLGWCFWRVRLHMRKVRWGIIAMITLLALVMKAPVWYIFDRVSLVTGGSGWHRSFLIDVAYRHLGEWYLMGMALAKTVDWFPYLNRVTDTADITNQYISFGLAAGFVSIAFFINLLTKVFSSLGRGLKIVRCEEQVPHEAEFLLWGLGVMLGVHVIDWFGIIYFDQMNVVWLMQLGAISSLTQVYFRKLKIPAVESAMTSISSSMTIASESHFRENSNQET